MKQYNFEATFDYTDEDYSTDYLSHETIKLMWKDQHTEIIETTQMDDACTVERLFELNLYGIGDIYSADWLIKHYDEWCNSFTGMDNYCEHKREMIDILKTHLQPLRIYSQFEDMMSEIPNGATEIEIYNSKITITVDPREQLDPSVEIVGYSYKLMPIAEIEIDLNDKTYTLTNIDERFHAVIDRTIDDLNYILYQGLD